MSATSAPFSQNCISFVATANRHSTHVQAPAGMTVSE
jgi:hypothetical protein